MDDYIADPVSRVVARWSDDGDGTGELSLRAGANGFSGVGTAWFNADEVVRFGERLDLFPLPTEPIELVGGFWAKDASGLLEQEHLGLRVAPVGNRGQIGVRIHLATEIWPGDRSASLHDVQLELLTTSQRLREFGRELAHVVNGTLAEAVLDGEKI